MLINVFLFVVVHLIFGGIQEKNESYNTIQSTMCDARTFQNDQKTENDYQKLSTFFIKKDKDLTRLTKWIKKIVQKDIDGDKSYMTEKCLSYVTDAIDYYWGYDGSIDEKTFYKKWSKVYDLKYSKFGHLFETGNGGWVSKKLIKIEYLGEYNAGDWFALTIQGGGEDEAAITIQRVVKIIRKNNAFYIDHFLSLKDE